MSVETIIKSPTKTVIIGPDHPFVVIGERINPTGRKKLAAEMQAGDFSRVRSDAIAQVAAGAHILDVNAGLGVANPHEVEPEVLSEAIRIVMEVVDIPICIDSSVIPALKAGLKTAWGKPIVNSVTGENERMEAVFPLIAEYGAAVIAISNDESGISYDPEVRFQVAKRIVERGGELRHPAQRCDRRPAGDAGRGRGRGWRSGLRYRAPRARGTGLQHHLWRVQHLLRSAQPPGSQCQLREHGHRLWHALRHHQPARA